MHSGAVVPLYVHTCLEAKFIVIVLKVPMHVMQASSKPDASGNLIMV